MTAVPNSSTPFLKVAIPVAAGLLLARLVAAPVWAAVLCLVVAAGAALFSRQESFRGIYLWSAVMLFFFAVGRVAMPQSHIPAGERVTVAVQLQQEPLVRGRWQSALARAGHFRAEGDSVWHRSDEAIQLYIDTCHCGLEAGTQLVLRGWFNPVDTAGTSYGSLMRLRGVFGRMYVTPGNVLRRTNDIRRTPAWYASRLQAAAVRKIEGLELPPNREGVVAAMTAGEKRGVDRELRGMYGDTGAAHLLAVSGLHVGIVFVLVNLLLYLLPAIPRGHVVRNGVAILCIWLYAVMSGLSPSAVRAALMFSFAQAALATSSWKDSLNVMLGSAVVMLAVNPNWAADPSFTLSYAAVLSIFAFFPTLHRPLRTRYKALNALTAVIIIGVTASIGTAPLVSYWFGRLSLAGVVINPLVGLTAYAIVMLGVVWVLMPFGVGRPVFACLLSGAAGVQNAAVEWCAGLKWAYVEVRLPLWAVVVSYGLLICSAVLARRAGRKNEHKSLFE